MSSTNQSLKRLKTGRFVTNSHVNMLRRNYEAKRWVENSKRIGKPDSLSVWYGLDDLKYFMNEAEKAGADGVRFYFGAYPSSFPEEPWREGIQTIVLVATKNEINHDGQPEDKDLYVQETGGPQMIAFNFTIPRPVGAGGQPPTFEDIPLLKAKEQSLAL